MKKRLLEAMGIGCVILCLAGATEKVIQVSAETTQESGESSQEDGEPSQESEEPSQEGEGDSAEGDVSSDGNWENIPVSAASGAGEWLQPSDELAGLEEMSEEELLAFVESKSENIPEEALSGNETASLSEDSPEEAEPEEEDEYADLAIAAQVQSYVNVRSEANTDSAIVGKMYTGSVAQILEVVGEEDPWLKVVSGNVEGYIKAEYFAYGDAAVEIVDDYVLRYAKVNATRLNVRKEPNIESTRVGYVDHGERVRLLEDQGEWMRVQYTESESGYVASEYVTIVEEFIYAKSIEEERAEMEAAAALAARAAVAEADAPEQTQPVQNQYAQVAPPALGAENSSELRAQVVNYAMQYLGNRYVHGGQSLASGTDCSGFTCYVYAAFGYSLSRTPEGQLSSAGRSVSFEEMQPGDVICYGKSRCTHVAMYIGNGQIIHAANSRKGVIIGNATYDNILGIKSIVD